jgi:hypothetical protein
MSDYSWVVVGLGYAACCVLFIVQWMQRDALRVAGVELERMRGEVASYPARMRREWIDREDQLANEILKLADALEAAREERDGLRDSVVPALITLEATDEILSFAADALDFNACQAELYRDGMELARLERDEARDEARGWRNECKVVDSEEKYAEA